MRACYFIQTVKDKCKMAAVCQWLIMAENKVKKNPVLWCPPFQY